LKPVDGLLRPCIKPSAACLTFRWRYIEELPDLQGSPGVHEAILKP
jgi:hypothetical protein